MPKNHMASNDQELLIDALVKNRNVDTKKLHERASELTRQKILLASLESFSTKGYHNSNIHDIAKEAGVTKGAVYHHFKDKKDLLMSANRWRQGYTSEALRKAISEEKDFCEALRKAFKGQFQLLETNPIIRGMVREYMAMAMIDSDVNQMHRQNDLELLDIMEVELERRHPTLTAERRAWLLQTFLVSLIGLFTALAANSPTVAQPEKMLDELIDSLRDSVEK